MDNADGGDGSTVASCARPPGAPAYAAPCAVGGAATARATAAGAPSGPR